MKIAFALASVTLMTFGAAAEEVRPDWADLVQKAGASQDIYVPNDTTWIIQGDSDLDVIDGGAKRIRFGGNGKIVLDGTTRYFQKLHSDSTTCEIIKRGVSTLTQTNGFSLYKGTLTIAAGVFVQKAYYPLAGNAGAHLYVEDGATLVVYGDCGLGDATVHLKGVGVGGCGALIVSNSANYAISGLVLDDDAYVVLNDASHNPISGADAPNSAASSNQYRSPGFINLNGHTLTIGGAATVITFNSEVFQGAGEVAFDALDEGVRTVVFSGAVGLSNLSGLAGLTFNSPAQIDFRVEEPCVANIVAKDSLEITATVASVSLGGIISGAADLTIDTSASAAVKTVRLGAVNTYTGSTSIAGAGTLEVLLDYGTTIPDFSRLTITGAKMVPMLGNDSAGNLRWTADQAMTFAAAYQVAGDQRKIVFDATDLTDSQRLVFDPSTVATYFPALDVVWDALGTGSGSYTLTGPYTGENPLNLNVLAGMVRLSGEEKIVLGDVAVSGTSAASSGTLVLDGAADVSFGEQIFSVGSTSTGLATPVARLVVTNSTLSSTYHPADFTNHDTGSLFVGRHAGGVLEVEAGAVISNKLVVGGGSTYSYGSGVGAVYQRGGVVRPFCGPTGHLTSGVGIGWHGSYELSGGLFRADGSFNIGGYACACFLQTEGTAEFGGMVLLPSHVGMASYTILGGTTKMTGNDQGGYPNLVSNTKGYAWVTVQGRDSLLTIKDSRYQVAYCGSIENSDAHAIYNLNDEGVFELKSLRVYRTTYASTYPLILNFNGGMFRMCAAGSPFCADTAYRLPKVVVYEKGIQIDTAGYAGSNVGGRIEAETEGGIQSIDLAGPLTGYHSIPHVDIAGDGYGASAVALVDSRTYSVTNILVTSHGWGYTAANTKVYLRYNTTLRHTFPDSAVTIGSNEVGGFTKHGENTFTVNYTNEWAKWTRVIGGTLKAQCDWAIPSNTVLTVAEDATLDLNGKQITFAGVTADSSGAVVNGTVEVTGDWPVDVADLIDGEGAARCGTFDADVNISDSVITLANAQLMDETLKGGYVVLKVAVGRSIMGTPIIVGLPDGWRFGCTGNKLRIFKPTGLMLLIR